MRNRESEDPARGWRELAEELCSFHTGVNTPGNVALFARLEQELPFVVHEYPAGSEYNGWVAPGRWSVARAEIRKDGKLIFDGKAHPLAVGALSASFQGTLDLDRLRPHIVSNEKLPSAYMFHCAWQYRPWAADWMFCMPWELAGGLASGAYDVDLRTEVEPEPMQVAEYRHEGDSPLTFVFQAHTCHPGQAEDGFGAVALLVRLFQWLRGQKTRFSYLLLLGPEHLGTVFWLKDKSREELERMIGGVFMEMPGLDAPLKAAASFLGDRYVDAAIRHVLRHSKEACEFVPWRKGAGNDETVWEAPGYEVPFVELTRCKSQFAPYDAYHSSLDVPAAMREDKATAMFAALRRIILVHELDAVPRRLFSGLVCLSNPRYNLYLEREDPSVADDGRAPEHVASILDSLFRYFDGDMSILEIAEKHDVSFFWLYSYLRGFEEKRLITLEQTRIPRRRIKEAASAGCS